MFIHLVVYVRNSRSQVYITAHLLYVRVKVVAISLAERIDGEPDVIHLRFLRDWRTYTILRINNLFHLQSRK